MSEKKKKTERKPRDDGVELEGQFIVRFPQEVADKINEAINEGNVQDRLYMNIDQDLRHGDVLFDDQMLHGKLVDLPTIVESYKTIDKKNLYKTADVNQMLIVKEEPHDETEKESPNKNKKRDPHKVDKKYLWPHGITPPCKNVRKRRFRKTLKKKNVETPDIEKEVKHLLRADNEAVRVEYEIIYEDTPNDGIETYNEADEGAQDETIKAGDKTADESASQLDVESDDDETSNFETNRAPVMGVAAHDIFGEEVSTTDDEDEPTMPNDFFGEPSSPKIRTASSSSNLAAPSSLYDNQQMMNKREEFENLGLMDDPQPQYTQQQIQDRINNLNRQISDLRAQQTQKSTEIASIQNATLKQRMQETLDNLFAQIKEREQELKNLENMLEQ